MRDSEPERFGQQSTRAAEAMLIYRWANVADGGPAIRQHGPNGSLASRRTHLACSSIRVTTQPENTRQARTNIGSMLGQRRRRWTNIEPMFGQRLVFAGVIGQTTSLAAMTTP